MSVTWNAVGSDKSLLDITKIATAEGYPSPNGDYELKVQDDGNLVLYENGTAVWYTGANHANLPLWRKNTRTANTDSSGRISLNVDVTKYTVVACWVTSSNTQVAVPYKGQTYWNAYIGDSASNLAKVASTSVTVAFLYVDKV